jgi:hypothetical protein
MVRNGGERVRHYTHDMSKSSCHGVLSAWTVYRRLLPFRQGPLFLAHMFAWSKPANFRTMLLASDKPRRADNRTISFLEIIYAQTLRETHSGPHARGYSPEKVWCERVFIGALLSWAPIATERIYALTNTRAVTKPAFLTWTYSVSCIASSQDIYSQATLSSQFSIHTKSRTRSSKNNSVSSSVNSFITFQTRSGSEMILLHIATWH